MSREIAEQQLAQAKQDILAYLDEADDVDFSRMISAFYPTPGYEKDIFGWAFWNLVNSGEIQFSNGQVANG